MSKERKLNLWQKLKRLLTSSAPQAIINATELKSPALNDSFDADNSHFEPFYNPSATIENQTTTKISLTKRSVKPNDSEPIVDYLKLYFRKNQWRYNYHKPKQSDPHRAHHISLRIQHKSTAYGYLFRAQEDNGLLAAYGILPFLMPKSHQSAAMLLITQINYDMIIGNLEMDVNDGEIRYKNAIDVDVVGMDDTVIEHLLQSVVAMTTVAHEVFGDLINTPDPSEDMPTLLGELRQQADARTYYLASKKTQ